MSECQIQNSAQTLDNAPSFKNCRELLKKIDTLPKGPGWSCDLLTVVGDLEDEEGEKLVEVLELWRRDLIECVRELIGKCEGFCLILSYFPLVT